jgi:hypothetical protein
MKSSLQCESGIVGATGLHERVGQIYPCPLQPGVEVERAVQRRYGVLVTAKINQDLA